MAVLTATVHQRKKTKPYSDTEDDSDDDYQDVGVDDSFYNNDPAVPTPVVPMALSRSMNAAICAEGHSSFSSSR